jgi:hypothetical protein
MRNTGERFWRSFSDSAIRIHSKQFISALVCYKYASSRGTFL